MPFKVRNIGPTSPRIVNTGPTHPRVSPGEIAAALGAEPVGTRVEAAGSPITLFALRRELFLRSQAGIPRPTADVATRSVTLAAPEWKEVERLAQAVSTPEAPRSASEIVHALVSLSIKQINGEAGKLAGELSARGAAPSA